MTTGMVSRMYKGKGDTKNTTQTPREQQGIGPLVEAGRGCVCVCEDGRGRGGRETQKG